jgi:catechol 2,3-dioxygenase-like lactoylglutathione lyase family enzyme
MIAYATVGSNDFASSARFFDAVLGALGHKRVHDYCDGGFLAYASSPDDAIKLWLCKPHDGKPASVGNGSMLGFSAASRAQVDAFHAAALAHGGSCEGAPGVRESYGPTMYLAYIRDPLGNKFSAVFDGK